MTTVLFSLVLTVTIWVKLASSTYGALVRAPVTVAPWKTNVDLVLYSVVPLSPLRYVALERDFSQYLNRALYPYYEVTDALVTSQVLLEPATTLELTWILHGISSSDGTLAQDYLDQVSKALNSQELNHLFNDEWRIGIILSTKASLNPEPTSVHINDIFDAHTDLVDLVSQTPTSPSTLTLSVFPSVSPTLFPHSSLPEGGTIVPNSLSFQTYRSNLTLSLAGISTTITSDELNAFESITKGFFRDYLPTFNDLILAIANVHVTSQTLIPSNDRRRQGGEDLVLELVIVGEAWSTSRLLLDDVPFDAIVNLAFVTHEQDFLSRLLASNSAFWNLDITPPTISNKDQSGNSSANDANGGGMNSLMTIIIVICVCGTLLVVVVGGSCYYLRKVDDSESLSDDDNAVQDLVDEESLSNSDISWMHRNRWERSSHFRYPLQQSRVDSVRSAQSPSLMSDSDFDNWSVISGPMAAEKQIFTMKDLDEFEASLSKHSPHRGSVENAFHRVDLSS